MKHYIPFVAVAVALAGTSVFARQAAAPPATPAPAARQAPAVPTPAGAAQAAPPAQPAVAGAQDIPSTPGQGRGGGPQPSPFATPPLRVFIYAGLKTHSEGQHDYPQFLADWSKLLMTRNAIVDGGLHFPSAKELGNSDVVVMYKGDAGYLSMEDRANLDAYVRRGGGLVSIHDALCGPDPGDFASLVGGAKKHGEVNYTLDASVDYTIVDPAHPIMQGMSNFKIQDEAFYLMTWAKSPEMHVLATSPIDATPSAKQAGHAGEVVPQVWTYEKQMGPNLPGAATGQSFRAFVWMQGHNYSNFALPQVQGMLLRGIAWAGKRSVDTLMTARPPRAGGRRAAPASTSGGTQ